MLRERIMGAVLAGVAAALGACTTLPVTVDVNPEYSLAICHTYAFAQEHAANANHPGAWGNPLNADRLRAAVEANLTARGVQKVTGSEAPDCIVGYALGTRQVFNDYYGGWGPAWGYGWGYGWGRGYYGYGAWGYDGPWVSNETRIAVDVFDAKAHKAIWHGAVSQTTYDLTGPNAEAKISAATAAIFAKMPIGTPPPAPPPAKKKGW